MNNNKIPGDDNTTGIDDKKVIQELDDYIQLLESMLSDAREENDRQFRRIGHLERLLKEIENAFWWRISQPIRSLSNGIRYILRNKKSDPAYNLWNLNKTDQNIQKAHRFGKEIKISIVVPLYNTPKAFLSDMLDSVIRQTYTNWELCLADGSDPGYEYIEEICKKQAKKHKGKIAYKKLERNLGISDNTNECIKMSTGDYIALLDHDDALSPAALYENMVAITERNADFIYSDECKFRKYRKDATEIFCKPDFSPDTLTGCNYICHLSVFSRRMLDKTQGFRNEFNGSQDYDIILRLTEQAGTIVHIPKVLYFWRVHADSAAGNIDAKPYAYTAAKRALSEHLERTNLKGVVTDSKIKGYYRINYELNACPLVSIIIIDTTASDISGMYTDSILRETSYKSIDVKTIKCTDNANLAKTINAAVSQATGEYIVLLAANTKVRSGNWIEEMLMFAQRSNVGAVGATTYQPGDIVHHAGLVFGKDYIVSCLHKGAVRGAFGYFGLLTIPRNLSCVSSDCIMLRKDVYTQVGGLDNSYDEILSDIDLCMKIRKAGYLIVWTPYAEIYHCGEGSSNYGNDFLSQESFQKDIQLFKERWANELEAGDPYFNINLPQNSVFKV